MSQSGRIMEKMIGYFQGDVRRINHFIKVYGFAKTIGELEGLGGEELEVLKIAALTHDIGIKISEEKYQSASGYYQQLEGPAEAKKLLESMSLNEELIERVCWLIAHHHTYQNIDRKDYQILVEADFLVNAQEDHMSKEAIVSIREKIFCTESGKKFLDYCYLVEK